MKPDIHPNYHTIKVKCVCGAEFEVGSTLKNDKLSVEVCSQCHPFYTGQQKVVKTKRVEQFRKRYETKPVKKAQPPKEPEAEEKVSKPAKKKAEAKKPAEIKKKTAPKKKEAKKPTEAKKPKVTVKKKTEKKDEKKK